MVRRGSRLRLVVDAAKMFERMAGDADLQLAPFPSADLKCNQRQKNASEAK